MYTATVLIRVSTVVRRRQDHVNQYKDKHLTGTGLRDQKFSTL